ncbi:hypothetical protein NPIL_327391 [Nephila pilipes]|uniref:Uncharacterized protein n=1 Tax=Nephila pilipes TaxID=299642 RepID=A0A8X6MHR1_NEPPI|nr:hypothetical protein NPIL_327391 [Nephila pilipes]
MLRCKLCRGWSRVCQWVESAKWELTPPLPFHLKFKKHALRCRVGRRGQKAYCNLRLCKGPRKRRDQLRILRPAVNQGEVSLCLMTPRGTIPQLSSAVAGKSFGGRECMMAFDNPFITQA